MSLIYRDGRPFMTPSTDERGRVFLESNARMFSEAEEDIRTAHEALGMTVHEVWPGEHLGGGKLQVLFQVGEFPPVELILST